ncbi:hypothetical protein DLAC_09465 [Tieghemostelium lacteum]|uniref:MORN repeat-containing protein n=1 Tax=Tieghemostelium lacteum TaxID=361077 RepID=A0A151Z6F6_TIELA|nr:hypothetical protein DLAC_09465 [Tieghemostelium lacteum]|eukprot:KYQ89517.1 hypothetical protein DLAC_09465 [Tieghemostelium lacteum]
MIIISFSNIKYYSSSSSSSSNNNNNTNVNEILKNLPNPKIEIEKLIERSKLQSLTIDDDNIIKSSIEIDKLKFPFEIEQEYHNDGKGHILNFHNIDNSSRREDVTYLDNAGLKATVKSKSGSVYEGQVSDTGIPNGFGELQLSNGDFFLGMFKDGRREGRGRLVCKNGNHFDGDWENDQRNGSGKWITAEGITHEGQWKNDELHGYGIYSTKDFEIKGLWVQGKLVYGHQVLKENQMEYYGDFKDNLWTGSGRISFPNGSVFIGSLKHNTPNGTGSWYNKPENQMIENDHWLNGKPNGNGRLYQTGLLIEGSWNNGELQNGALYSQDNQSIYKGELKDYIPNGKGEEYYSDESVYKGSFVNGYKQGKGLMTWSNGSTYNGDWIKNLKIGSGVLKTIDGEIYQAEFKETLVDPSSSKTTLYGRGTYHKSDGSIYNGEFINGIPNGTGYYLKNQIRTNGLWKDGKLIKEL